MLPPVTSNKWQESLSIWWQSLGRLFLGDPFSWTIFPLQLLSYIILVLKYWQRLTNTDPEAWGSQFVTPQRTKECLDWKGVHDRKGVVLSTSETRKGCDSDAVRTKEENKKNKKKKNLWVTQSQRSRQLAEAMFSAEDHGALWGEEQRMGSSWGRQNAGREPQSHRSPGAWMTDCVPYWMRTVAWDLMHHLLSQRTHKKTENKQ